MHFYLKIPIALILVLALSLLLDKYVRMIRMQEIRKRLETEGMTIFAMVPLIFEVIKAAIMFLIEFPKRMKYMISTLELVGKGLLGELTGIAESVPIIVEDTIKLVTCGMKQAGNFNKCAKYYGLSLVLHTIYSILVEFPVFLIRTVMGVDLQSAVDSVWFMINCLDDLFFGMSGIHISRYSDEVIEMCYNCDMPDPADGGKILHKLGDPAKDLINGAMTFMSVFTGKKPTLM